MRLHGRSGVGGSAPGDHAAVARSVTKKEAAGNPKAQAALDAEWTRLRKISTWEEEKALVDEISATLILQAYLERI